MIKKAILYLWQLPQNVLGWVLSRGGKVVDDYTYCGIRGKVFVKKNFFRSGVCLGQYIILDVLCLQNFSTIPHEKGHQMQSLFFGWLYLLLVGLPSVCLNLWGRIFHQKWTQEQRYEWYHSHYPENWADELGGVN